MFYLYISDKYLKNIDCICKDRLIPLESETKNKNTKTSNSPNNNESKLKPKNLSELKNKSPNSSIILLNSADEDDDFIGYPFYCNSYSTRPCKIICLEDSFIEDRLNLRN